MESKQLQQIAESWFDAELDKTIFQESKEAALYYKEQYLATYRAGFREGQKQAQPGAVWVKANITKVLEWAEKFYSENAEQLMLDDNVWYISELEEYSEDVRNCREVTAEELADLYLMHHPDESAAGIITYNPRYELCLALRDMVKLVKRIYGDDAIPVEYQKRIEAADGMLNKHFKVTDVLRGESAAGREEAVEFAEWAGWDWRRVEGKSMWENQKTLEVLSSSKLYEKYKEETNR